MIQPTGAALLVDVLAPDPAGAARAKHVLDPAKRAAAAVFAHYGPHELAILFDFFARSTDALRTAARAARPAEPDTATTREADSGAKASSVKSVIIT